MVTAAEISNALSLIEQARRELVGDDRLQYIRNELEAVYSHLRPWEDAQQEIEAEANRSK